MKNTEPKDLSAAALEGLYDAAVRQVSRADEAVAVRQRGLDEAVSHREDVQAEALKWWGLWSHRLLDA